MEAQSCIANDVICYNVAKVHLSESSLASQGAYLRTPSHDIRRSSFDLTAGPIALEPGCWVAAQAFIGPGVRIALHSLVGARAVVTKDVPANKVVVGNRQLS